MNQPLLQAYRIIIYLALYLENAGFDSYCKYWFILIISGFPQFLLAGVSVAP
jgi:hypothetical protein